MSDMPIPKKRGRPPKNRNSQHIANDVTEGLLERAGKVDLASLPLETREDYFKYNEEARKQRKPIKFLPHDFFPKQRVRFVRMDNQTGNPLKLRFRSAEKLIDFNSERDLEEKMLMDSQEYDLPLPVIEHLNSRKVPRYKQVKYPDGTHETVLSHHEHRFSCQMVM